MHVFVSLCVCVCVCVCARACVHACMCVRSSWGNEECIDQMIKRRRLEWLGHIAYMPDNRIPRKVLFGWLQQPRSQGGPRRR